MRLKAPFGRADTLQICVRACVRVPVPWMRVQVAIVVNALKNNVVTLIKVRY